MRVLIIPSWYPTQSNPIGGVFFREQALALHTYGHEVSVLYPEFRSLRNWRSIATGRYGVVRENDDGITTLRSHGMVWVPRMPHASDWLWIHEGVRLYEAFKREFGHPDLIHAHAMLNAGHVAMAIERRYGVPFIVTEHDSGYARGTLGRRRLQGAKVVARRASRRFAVSRPFCALLDDLFGLSTGSWEEMPNIVERRFIDAPLRNRDGKGNAFRFINVSLLTENKGVHYLIRAFAHAFANDACVTLDIGGDGVERARLEALAHDEGVSDRVRFLGTLSRDEVVKAVSEADAFVLSSTFETFGVVAIEALALGTPVVATRCGGPESIVRPQDGILVATDDVDALASGMKRLRTNHDQYDASEMRNSCIARYSEEAIARRLSHAYEAVVASSARP